MGGVGCGALGGGFWGNGGQWERIEAGKTIEYERSLGRSWLGHGFSCADFTDCAYNLVVGPLGLSREEIRHADSISSGGRGAVGYTTPR